MTTLDFDDSEIYELLLTICAQYQVDPSASIESENFFRNLLAQYKSSSDIESLSKWLSEQIDHWFVALGKRPKWVQSSEWQFLDGIPAVFVGQIDVSTEDNERASKVFHDDTSFYVFIGKKKPPIVIMQQY